MVTEQPLLVRSPPSSIMALARACPGPPLSFIAYSIVAAETEKMVYAARAPASCLSKKILMARWMAKGCAKTC